MQIYIYRYGSICEPDYIQGFRSLGFDIIEETAEIHKKDLTPSECVNLVSPKLMNHRYAFVFTINFFPWLADLCEITKQTYISVIVDSPVLELYSHSLEKSCNRVFLFDQALYEEFESRNPGHIYHLPLCAYTTHFNQVIAEAIRADSKEVDANGVDIKKQMQRYQSDISFIGSTYQEKCLFNQLNMSQYWSGFSTGLIEAQLKVYGYNFIRDVIPDELITDIRQHNPDLYQFSKGSIPAYKEMIADQYLSVKVGEQERLRALRMLSDHYNVSIYTNSDVSSMPHIHNRGFARSQSEMPLIFHQSKINLNITAKSIKTGLSQRIFDVLGCQGFLITNYQSELEQQFEPGKDLVVYSSLDELDQLCSYSLNHDEERQAIADHGYQTVLQLHTMEKRLVQMLQIVFP